MLTLVLALQPVANLQVQLEFSLNGAATGDQFGFSVASAGDFNGDGFSDLVVGANANTEAGIGSGKVYVYYGGPSADTLADWTATGVVSELFGSEVSGVGDINSDGYGDILVGATSNDQNGASAGRAALFFGGNPPDTIADWTAYGESSVDYFGTALAGGRDLTGDDTVDFLVSAFRFDPPSQSNTGKIYLYRGGVAPSTTPFLEPVGQSDGERFGCALATTDDFTGDGYPDYVVGAYSYDSGSGGTNAGRVLLMRAGLVPSAFPVGEFDGATGGELSGWSLADVGDVNGDGDADILAGAYGYPVGSTLDAGRAYLFFGGAALDSAPDFTVTAASGASQRLGYGLAGRVDLNSDTFTDFAIGAPGDPGGGGQGRTYVYTGGPSPTLDTTLTATGGGTEFGRRLAMIKNFFGSKSALAVGAWGENNSRGAVYVYRHAGGATPARGDVNNDGVITAGDIIYLVNYVFKAGPDPIGGVAVGDVNCSGAITAADIIYLVNYVFKAGTPPCP